MGSVIGAEAALIRRTTLPVERRYFLKVIICLFHTLWRSEHAEAFHRHCIACILQSRQISCGMSLQDLQKEEEILMKRFLLFFCTFYCLRSALESEFKRLDLKLNQMLPQPLKQMKTRQEYSIRAERSKSEQHLPCTPPPLPRARLLPTAVVGPPEDSPWLWRAACPFAGQTPRRAWAMEAVGA